ncbi:hypothetical protein, partial [Myxococcus sp. AB025B]|uniref:hypothetical protein n=1 Tax=Myxococcus sp. AB025B TaxID=2562794 RepID=UPI001142BAE8
MGQGQTLGPEVLGQLVRGDVSVVVLRDLLPRETFDSHCQRIKGQFARATTTRYVNGALTTIGPYLARFLPDPEPYFREAEQTHDLFRELGFDLSTRVRGRLKETLGLRAFEPAREPDGRPYA